MVVRALSACSGIQDQLEHFWSAASAGDAAKPAAPFVAGFVVGQRLPAATSKEDLVVHLAPTPTPEDDDDDEEKSPAVDCVEKLDVPWMLEHHVQIARMLPGGLDVVGVFFVDGGGADDLFGSSVGMTHVRKVLRVVSERDGGGEDSSPGDFAVLHLGRATRKVSARWMDVCPRAAQTLKPAEFRLQSSPSRWQKVEGTLLLDLPVVFTAADEARPLLRDKVESALAPFFDNCVRDAFVVIGGSFRAGEEMLDPSQQQQHSAKSGKGGKKKRGGGRVEESDSEGEDDGVCKTHSVEFLLSGDAPTGGGEQEDCRVETIASRMRFSGKMYVCAFLHPRATVSEAERAVKKDLVRSLRGRFQMHCDSLVGDEASGSEVPDTPILHEPPRRIIVELPHCSGGVAISDYLFPGETPYDSNDSVEEIFGFKPAIESFDDEIELVAGPTETRGTLGSDSGDDSRASSPAAVMPEKESSLVDGAHCSPLFLVGALAAVAVAVAAAYFAVFSSADGGAGDGGDDDGPAVGGGGEGDM